MDFFRKRREITVRTKFYGENPCDDPNQEFGREQLPKGCKCILKELQLNQTNEYDYPSGWHYALWSCKEN